jgi:host factor-I protein
MEKPAAQNIQDAFLNSARRERIAVVVHLLQGSTLSGRIKSFDKFSVLLDVGGQDVLIFKHAISTVSQEKKAPTE